MGGGMPAEVFVEQYRELTAEGLDRHGVAARLGVTRDAVDMAVRRAVSRGYDLTPSRIGDDDMFGDLGSISAQAACRDEDPELFFSNGNGPMPADQAAEAKAVCRRCPAADECLQYALRWRVAGVWGGTTEEERKRMRNKGAAA